MKKFVLLNILTAYCLTGFAQVWSDDFGNLDSLHVGGYVANVKGLYNDNDNMLYIGGPFLYANLELVNQIIGWDGYNYFKFQNGVSNVGTINTIAKYNSNIVVGGTFPNASGVANTNRLTQWNGTNWQSVSNLFPNGEVMDLVVYNDTLFIGGNFNEIGTGVYYMVAAFSNGNWINIGFWGQWVSGLEFLNGELYGGGYYGFRRYLGGTDWEIFPDQPNGNVYELKTDTINSLLYVCGGFYQVGDSVSSGVAVWDGFKWIYTGYYCHTVPWAQSVAIYRGDLFTGCGSYYVNETEFRAYITRWNGESWDSIGGAFNNPILALEVFRDTLYIGGGFETWDSIPDGDGICSKGLVKLYMPDNGCDYLKPRINTWTDTFYLNGGEAVVNLYNNNPYADSWEWDFGTSTGSVPLTTAVEHSYSEVGEYNVQVTVTDGECVKTANKTIYIELGDEIKDFKKIEMHVFPNPSSHNFTVKLELPDYKNAELKIAGQNGHLKSVIPVTGETTEIITKGWSAGTYICNLFVDGKLVKAEKLVLE